MHASDPMAARLQTLCIEASTGLLAHSLLFIRQLWQSCCCCYCWNLLWTSSCIKQPNFAFKPCLQADWPTDRTWINEWASKSQPVPKVELRSSAITLIIIIIVICSIIEMCIWFQLAALLLLLHNAAYVIVIGDRDHHSYYHHYLWSWW